MDNIKHENTIKNQGIIIWAQQEQFNDLHTSKQIRDMYASK